MRRPVRYGTKKPKKQQQQQQQEQQDQEETEQPEGTAEDQSKISLKYAGYKEVQFSSLPNFLQKNFPQCFYLPFGQVEGKIH